MQVARSALIATEGSSKSALRAELGAQSLCCQCPPQGWLQGRGRWAADQMSVDVMYTLRRALAEWKQPLLLVWP